MKRALTIRFEFDDYPWFAEDEGKWYESDAVAYAVDIVKDAALLHSDEFVKAELDGTLLISKNGEVSEEVKKLATCETIMHLLVETENNTLS